MSCTSSAAGTVGESRPTGSPAVDAPPLTSTRSQEPTSSVAPPQPVIPADADDDTKLAMYKDKLKYYALGSASADSNSSS
jgi:hypothetical protein